MEPGQAWAAANPAASQLPKDTNAIHDRASRVVDRPPREITGPIQDPTPDPSPRRVAVLRGGLHGNRPNGPVPVARVNAGPRPVRFASTRAIVSGPVVRRAALAVSFLAGMGIEKYLAH